MFSLGVVLKSLTIEMQNSKAVHQRCSSEKLCRKYAANLQENAHVDV